MSISIRTNTSSLIAQSSLTNSTNKLNQTIERMSTGLKLNHADDNAANYLINTQLSTKLSSYYVAEDNLGQAIDMVNTAAESLSLMRSNVMRLRSLAMQMQNETMDISKTSPLNKEAVAIINELYREKNTASYNGISLFGGVEKASEITFPDGSTQKTRGFMVKVSKRDTSKMTSIESLDKDTVTTGGTYSISTAEELVKAAEMTKAGTLKSAELVLANNIDMEQWCKDNASTGGWQGLGGFTKFDGNGYVIANVTIGVLSSAKSFFGDGKTIENVGLENITVSKPNTDGACAFGGYGFRATNCYATGKVNGKNQVGGLVGQGKGTVLVNCYADMEVHGASNAVGGLIGYIDPNASWRMENCFSIGTVESNTCVGGLIGMIAVRGDRTGTLINCVSTSDVIASTSAGGLIGSLGSAGTLNFSNCYSTGSVSKGDTNGGLIGTNTYTGTIDNCFYDKESSGQNDSGKGIGLTSVELYARIAKGLLPDYDLDLPVSGIYDGGAGNLYSPSSVDFWVGGNVSDSDKISMNLNFTIKGLKELCYLGLASDVSLEKIDEMLNSITDKESEIGALQNRFESALEVVSINIENLASTQSTVRDADMGEVSSEYIKMQILQNASATLLSTANQTPALALQLL